MNCVKAPTSRKRGIALPYILVGFAVLCGFASLVVDYARVQLTKTQLQRAVDAASRAALSNLRNGVSAAKNAAVTYAANNTADANPVVLDPTNDVEFGRWDPSTRSFTVLTGSQQSNANAVRVTARRTASRGNALSLSFASILGMSNIDLQVQAIAAASTSGFAVVGLSSVTTAQKHGPIHIDSWNSNNGSYLGYPMNSNGSVSSNGNIVLDSSTVINGDSHAGIGMSTTGGTVTGSTSALTSALNYPPPDPGTAVTSNNNSSIPAAYFNSTTRDFTTPNGTTLTLPGGTYYVNNVSWNASTITFTGPAVIYITGNTFFTFNNTVNTYQNLPANLKFEVTGACTVTYDFDTPCYAVVYAPLATVNTQGYADDYGAIVGKTLKLQAGWHVDEALGGAGVLGAVVTVK